MTTNHWLIDLARSDGLLGAEALEMPPRTPIEAVWSAVEAASRVPEAALVRRVAGHFRLPVADLGRALCAEANALPEYLVREHLVFPLRHQGHSLVVATADPCDLEAEQAISFANGHAPRFEIASPRAIREAIDAAFAQEPPSETLFARLRNTPPELLEAQARALAEGRQAIHPLLEVESAPVVTLANLILKSAIADRASDIHIEPELEKASVRFRVDGVLHYRASLPIVVHDSVVARIKVMANMDIADHLHPQDGRARISDEGHDYDLRISTVPTRETEKVVIRILDPVTSRRLEDLSIRPIELTRFRQLLDTRDGIVAVTGPTGCGKTTTLYAALTELATGEENIMTVEEPVEYELPGITQIQVEPKQGVKFANTLRHILRQDPDIVFVGEIRDLETAEMAAQASMTGHLVLTTLHTNDAVGSVIRLNDLGLSNHLISETMRGSIAQRLVRRLCPECASSEGPFTDEELRVAAAYGIERPVRAIGCRRCERTGYRGRIPILEVMVRTPEIQELIAAGSPATALTRAAIRGGMRPLAEVAIERVRLGETTLEEVRRTIGDIPAALADSGQGESEEGHRIHLVRAAGPEAARPDPLTGLPDRNGFVQAYQAALRSRRAGEPLAVGVVEVDRLAEVEARHGRGIADRLVRRAGRILSGVVGAGATVARWRGGEFAIVFPGADAERARILVAQALAEYAGGPVLAEGRPVPATLSAGVAEIEGRATAQEALAGADRFLQRAQAMGGNRLLGGKPAGVFFLETPVPAV